MSAYCTKGAVLKGTAPLNFLLQCTFNWSRNGLKCVSSTSFGLKSAPKTKCWCKMVRDPTTRGACPHQGERFGWGRRHSWWGPLNISPPKYRYLGTIRSPNYVKTHPARFQTKKKLTETNLVLAGQSKLGIIA